MTEPRTRKSGRRALLLLLALAILFVVMPFLFWRQTWFGRRLNDREIGAYLGDANQGRRLQHALVQVSERMVAGDASVRQWYPGVLRAAASPNAAVRATAAWTMGQDPGSELLHGGLRSLLRDPAIEVRRNAALALVRFGDTAGHAELVSALRPHEIKSAKGGLLRMLVHRGQGVGAGTRVATLSSESGAEEQPSAPFSARVASVFVPDGARVQPGTALVALAPRAEDAWEALRGLYLIGNRDDLPDIERYIRGVPDMPRQIARQAELTARAIRTRLEPSPSH